MNRSEFLESVMAITEAGHPLSNAAVRRLRTDLQDFIAEHAEDEIDPDWLLANGFTGGNDEPDVDIYQRHSENIPIYQRHSGNGGPRVQITIRFRNGEQVASTLFLAWDYNGPFNVGLRYAIADNPTRGHVIRLCKALGFDSA